MPLILADPANRARAVLFDEFADTILTAEAGPIFFNRIASPKFIGKPGDDAAAAKDGGGVTNKYVIQT